MKRIFSSKACPFDFADWKGQNVKKLFAGNCCVMAITQRGEVLQKVLKKELAARTSYWTRISDIAISHCFEALAVGLVEDGTCMVAKRALRRCCEITGNDFDRIHARIKALEGIVQVAVSDAIFALDGEGNVHHIPLWQQDDYEQVCSWQNIHHIATGSQNAVFGVTNEGTVVCAGGNCRSGAMGNLCEKLATYQNVIDVCAMGFECENVLLALSDGRVVSLGDRSPERTHWGKYPVFCSSPLLTGIRVGEGRLAWEVYGFHIPPEELPDSEKIAFCAVGAEDSRPGFAVWCREKSMDSIWHRS